jgi:hypothetical protein
MIGEFSLSAQGPEGPRWSKTYAEALRVFLRDTEAGVQLRAQIEAHRPKAVLVSVEAAAVSGAKVAGYNLLAQLIADLSYPVVEEPTGDVGGFPDLDDESQWNGATPKS